MSSDFLQCLVANVERVAEIVLALEGARICPKPKRHSKNNAYNEGCMQILWEVLWKAGCEVGVTHSVSSKGVLFVSSLFKITNCRSWKSETVKVVTLVTSNNNVLYSDNICEQLLQVLRPALFRSMVHPANYVDTNEGSTFDGRASKETVCQNTAKRKVYTCQGCRQPGHCITHCCPQRLQVSPVIAGGVSPPHDVSALNQRDVPMETVPNAIDETAVTAVEIEDELDDANCKNLMYSCVFKDPQDITFSNHFATKYAKWNEDEANMLHSMYCCAFICGVTDWGGQSANQAGFRMVDPVKTNPARPDEDVPDALQVANSGPSADEANDVREAAKDEHVPLYTLSNYRLRQHMQCEDTMKNQKWW
ncbi:hypothetical protein CEUSTIGMA_g11777.t1 [Chlamydomonas eustigma]|uniref:Uncharacterized protein n=1 Tax=Chlamydomonas eustigma TaxID=1157962 RepID=A0A250XMN4_9CHLO|nr:hypothetical protein CEUSTIGMA_g11777.t1 [Chlamydomonas eustigma]|eukprot:GAX84355.1 hypothetical protein CEUSTIGMA_g11777.t1 [Chlamydomonas eustigma]